MMLRSRGSETLSQKPRCTCQEAPCCSRAPVVLSNSAKARVSETRRATQSLTASAVTSQSPVTSTSTLVADNIDVCISSFPAPKAGTFAPDRSFFSEEHRIRGYEVHPDQEATIVTIANLLQEIAGNHAVGMWGRTDNGFANLPSMKDLIFVMTRLQIRMLSYPKWGDIVQLETCFAEEGRLAARRDWRIIDPRTGEVLGSATSTWVTINTATRKLAKLPDDLKSRFMKFSTPAPRHRIPTEETKRKLPRSSSFGIEGPKQVARRSDMDMNGHINNVTYLAWALETLPQSVYDNYKLFEIEIDFKAECKAGELVEGACMPLTSEGQPPASSNGNGQHAPSSSQQQSSSLQFLHTLRRCDESGCYELVRCRTTWKK